ncbi:unnamed protein product [Anisakis simplex]|uniref:Uncharacterized protein n=1 Tax=Anisakis simplex TaxID=6269 RepID=A0A3P6U8X9_ANISI|nr:unnamed protein product [Anisakis simplex]
MDAFIWDSTRLEFEAARNCELRTRGALHYDGKMEELYEKWITSPSSKECIQGPPKSPARLGLTNMRDVFILVSGGIGVGIVLSMIEVSYGGRKAAKRYEIFF